MRLLRFSPAEYNASLNDGSPEIAQLLSDE
jgi:hypothetical protein